MVNQNTSQYEEYNVNVKGNKCYAEKKLAKTITYDYNRNYNVNSSFNYGPY